MLRIALCVSIVVGALASPARAEPATLDEAIAQATRSHRALVVEVHAAWCGPCHYFSQRILTEPAVRSALRSVEFVRFDVDTPAGEEVSQRYRTQAVPTFLVLSPGGELERLVPGLHGRDHAEVVAWFVDLVDSAARQPGATVRLEATVAARPDDARARLALARRYLALGRRADALAQLDAAPVPRDRALAATIQAEAIELRAAGDRLASAIDDAAVLVGAFPDSSLASERLARIAVSGLRPPEVIYELAVRHLAAVRGPALIGAVRAAIVAGATDEAVAEVTRRLRATPGDATVRLARAELALYDHDTEAARATVAELCRAPGPSVQLHCYMLEYALALGRVPTGADALRDAARGYLEDLDNPGGRVWRASQLELIDSPTFSNALARVLREAGARCQAREAASPLVAVALTLARDGGHPLDVDVLGDDAAVAGCLRYALREARLPAVPPRLDERLMVAVVVRPRTTRDETHEAGRAPALARGVVLLGVARTGVVGGGGAAIHAMRGGEARGDLHFVIGGEAEVGVAAAAAAIFAARVLGGPAVRLNQYGSVALLLGVGTSAAGDRVPVGFELPVELRLQLVRGRYRGQVWARAAWLYGEASRHPDEPVPLFGADEMELGAGASLPVAGPRLFVGASYQRQSIGASVSVLAGVPLGAWF